MKAIATIWILLLCLLLVACATRPPAPSEEMGAARAAFESAQQAGAAELAPNEFQQARQTLEQAEQALEREEHEQAGRLAREAEVEARHAAARAQSERSERMIAELEQSIGDLRAELRRGANERRERP